jgi:hypothetical protein
MEGPEKIHPEPDKIRTVVLEYGLPPASFPVIRGEQKKRSAARLSYRTEFPPLFHCDRIYFVNHLSRFLNISLELMLESI